MFFRFKTCVIEKCLKIVIILLMYFVCSRIAEVNRCMHYVFGSPAVLHCRCKMTRRKRSPIGYHRFNLRTSTAYWPMKYAKSSTLNLMPLSVPVRSWMDPEKPILTRKNHQCALAYCIWLLQLRFQPTWSILVPCIQIVCYEQCKSVAMTQIFEMTPLESWRWVRHSAHAVGKSKPIDSGVVLLGWSWWGSEEVGQNDVFYF